MDTYGRRLTVDLPFDTAVDELLQALKTNGLAILSRTDVRALLGRLAHHDFRRYVWVEVAAPSVALEALRTDLCVGAVRDQGPGVPPGDEERVFLVPRHENEFSPGGEAHIQRADPLTATDQQWAEYLYYRSNPKGAHRERWVHTLGCYPSH